MLSAFDLRAVKKLAQLSKDNDVALRCSHVAALYNKKRLLSLGVNKTKTHPLAYRLSRRQAKQYLHAELDCLLGMAGDLRRTTLYVVRIDGNGQLAMSKPCVHCSTYIQELGVGRVVYSVDGGIIEIGTR